MPDIAHTFLESLGTSHTGDLCWFDVSGTTLTCCKFVACGKYLLLFNSKIGASSSIRQYGIRAVHGSTPTVFDGGTFVREQDNIQHRNDLTL